ncbi:MAG: endopeptidase La [Ruminococcaceae bacterium]|nr:endopeptidase La [Oscillospiraceae bacterium]
MPTYIEKVERASMPMIPLRGLVAFPSIPINLDLERDFSIAAAEASEKGDRLLFLICQKDISIEVPEEGDFFLTGTVVKIRQTLRTPDGILRVIAEGLCRATVCSVNHDGPYYTADIMTKTVQLSEDSGNLKVEALSREVLESLANMINHVPSLSGDIITAVAALKNPGLMADFIAANIFVRLEDKQQILDDFDPMKRLERCAVLIESETRLLRLEGKIHKKVREQIDENQRDYYLREQMKVIQQELGGSDGDDVAEYYLKLDNTPLPDEVREKVQKEITHLSRSPFASPEASSIRSYLDAVLDFPWMKSSQDKLDIKKAEKILNADHYGLEKVKERILEFLAVKKLCPDHGSQILCFVGPPGVGKTSLGASIARAMNREYARVSLGGVRDEAEIRGHRRTYVASMPGRIVAALTKAGVNNPVMLLDEIDKLCADNHGDPASAMLEVLDPEQNRTFRDHFIELPVDLSSCFFIATANTLDTVPRPLIDRMEIIELHTYTRNEKLHIAKDHLIAKQVRRHGLALRQVRFSDDAIFEMIDGYTRESGVRNLERCIANVCRKTAKIITDGKSKRVSLTKDNIKDYLGTRKFLDEKKNDCDLVGVVNGLAYTEVGGDILKIETAVMEGTGKLELTGTLGDVMKESAKIAVSYIRANADALGVPKDFYKTLDIHIHVPEGAVPKDGPSAGVTMLTSLVSTLTGRAVRSDIAMTGELTLTGRVLAIGGLREKTTAAYSAGVTRVIIPYDNTGDIDEIDPDVRAGLTFSPCKTAAEVLELALLPKNEFANTASDGGHADNIKSAPIIPEAHHAPNAYCEKR